MQRRKLKLDALAVESFATAGGCTGPEYSCGLPVVC